METKAAYKTHITKQTKFLNDLYGEELSFHSYLRLLGFSEEQSQHILKNCWLETREAIKLSMKTYFVMKHDGERLTEIIAKYYGLEGSSNTTLQSISNEFGISRERVRQLIEKGIRKLRNTEARTFFENDLRNQLSGIIKSHPIGIYPTKGDEAPFFIPDLEYCELSVVSKSDLKDPRTVKTYSLAETRMKHPRAYEKWTTEEDKTLSDLHKQGKKIDELTQYFQRNAGAIRSRLRKQKMRGI